MGIITSVISFLIVLTVGRHVVSATDCKESNCEFVVREECQNSESVICSMKDRPLKQIDITAASFPRGVREIKISNAEIISIGEDSISSLEFLEEIEITNVNTLILLNNSLARGGISERITVRIRAVKDLRLHSKTFQDWRGGSRITITDVDDCQLLPFSAASTQFRGLTLSGIRSLAFHESAFSDDSLIDKIDMMGIKSLSISTQAFTSNVTVHKTWIEDIENLTIYSGALSRNSRMTEARLEKVRYLNIEPDGIEADIVELKVKDVGMETCGENTFGDMIGSLSLSSSHIKRTRKHCISACKWMTSLILENSEFDEIETSGICGTVGTVKIKNNTFGTIAKGGLQLNVTKFSIEYSAIAEASEEALVVRADNDITIRNCTIDVLKKGAFRSVSVMQENSTGRNRILLDNLHIKHPQNDSLQFDQTQKITMHDLTLDIPCTCDIATALGLDVASENEFWIHQPLCVINGFRPILGHYLQKFCPKPITIPPPTNPTNLLSGSRPPLPSTTDANLHRGGRPPLRGKPPLPPQTAGESSEQDPQTIPETRDQTSGDGSDQVRTGFTHNEILVAIIIPAVLIALAVTAFFVRRHFRQRSRAEGQNGGRRRRTTRHSGIGDVALWSRVPAGDRQTSESSQHALLDPSDGQHTDPHQVQFPTVPLHPSDDQRTHGPDSRPTISAPIQNYVPGSVDTASHQPADQGAPDSTNSAGTAETHTSRGTKPEKKSEGVRQKSQKFQPPHSPTESYGMSEPGHEMTHDTGNTTGDTSHQDMEDVIDRPTSAGPVSTYTSRGPEQLEKGSRSPCLLPYDQEGAGGGSEHGHGDYGGTRHYVTVPHPPPKPPQLVPFDSEYREGGNVDRLFCPPDERYKLSASYRMDRPKDPRIQKLARDPQYAQRFEKESEL